MTKQKALATINNRIDKIIMKEKERGYMTSSEKQSFKNLCKFHKTLVAR